jgi:hypothetical protein
MDEATATPNTAAEIAIAHLQMATSYLSGFPAVDDPIGHVLAAIARIQQASMAFPDLCALGSPLGSALQHRLFTCAASLGEIVAPVMTEEEVHFGLGFVAGMLGPLEPDLIEDRRSYARIFGADLEKLRQRRAIASRGSPFMRTLAISRALFGTSDADISVN